MIFIDIVMDRKGLLDYVDNPAATKCCILDPHIADKVIDQFDEICKPEVAKPRYFSLSCS